MANVNIKKANTVAASLCSKSGVLMPHAEAIAARATANAAAHRETGEYSNNFKVKMEPWKPGAGVRDAFAYNDHPAALAIEFGHFQTSHGRPTGAFVSGQYNLTRAVQ